MSIALSEFWTRLVRSGITDAAGCKQLAAAFSQANQGTPPSDSKLLAEFLTESGSLTAFQANALLAEPPRELRSGHYLIRSDCGPTPLSRWIPVRRLDDGRTGLLYRISNEQLTGGRDQWLQAHQEVVVDGLQRFEYENQPAWTLVFSELPEGQCLKDFLASGGSLVPALACKLGIAVAQALEAMHQRPLVHGAVRADHVWMGHDGQVTLLRDPSGPPLKLGVEGTGHWLDAAEQSELYAAPELAHPDQKPSPEADIYSLGCLLFRLVAGRYPIEGDSLANTLAAHATKMPPELTAAIAKGEAGDPFYRVIAFALAKSPSARFASAAQLTSALTAILPLVGGETSGEGTASQDASASKPSKPKAISSPSSTTAPVASAPPKGVKRSAERAAPTAKKKSSKQSDPKTASPLSKPADQQRKKLQASSDAAGKKAKQKTKQVSPSKPTKDRSKVPQSAPTVVMPSGNEPTKSTSLHPVDPSAEIQPVTPTVAASVASDQVTQQVLPTDAPPAGSSPLSEPPAPPTGSEATTRRPQRSRKKKKSKAPIVLGALCVAVLMLVISLAVPRGADPEQVRPGQRPQIPDVIPAVTNRPTPRVEPQSTPESVAGYELVADDRLLFVPPYAADTKSASLEFLPPGPAIILSLRVAPILKSRLGADLVATLSPELDALITKISERAKLPTDAIESCGVALHPGKEGWPQVSLAITLKTPVSAKELLDKWQVAAARTADGATIYAGDTVDGDAIYFQGDANASIQRFAIGSVERMSEVAAAEGGAIPLPRSAQTLWNASSDQADLVALISPNFLFADGREMLAASAPELVSPLKSTLQPDVAAMLVTFDIDGDRIFAETRLAPSGGISEAALMRGISDRVDQWPQWADEFIVDSVPDPSWRLLASRLPSMMRFVVDRVRFGISDGAVVANTYLPAQAVPQVTLATLLAMNTPAGNTVAVARPKIQRPLTVDEMLNRKMSVSFDQESLEFAIDSIVIAFERELPSGSTMPPVRIIGGDLQLMGITQNQQVRDFAKNDIPLRQVLTDLVLGANPDKTATGPKDEKQALIWVIADDQENPGKNVILVTTRQAAVDKYDLPAEFVTE